MGGTEPRANARGRGRAEGRPSVKDEGQRGRSMTQGRRRGQREEPEGKEDRDRSRCLVHSGGRTAWRQQRLDTLWLEPGLRAPVPRGGGGADLLRSSKPLSIPGGWSSGLLHVEELLAISPQVSWVRQVAPLCTPSSFQHQTKNKHGRPTRDTLQSPCVSESTSLGRDPYLRTEVSNTWAGTREACGRKMGPPAWERGLGQGRLTVSRPSPTRLPAPARTGPAQLAPGEEVGGGDGDEGSSQSRARDARSQLPGAERPAHSHSAAVAPGFRTTVR